MSVRAYFGALLLFLGAGFLGETLALWDFGGILASWWPLLVILFGVLQLVTRSISIFAGAFITFIGVLLQVSLLRGLGFDAGTLIWPLILIFIGGWLILSRTSLFPGRVSVEDGMNYFVAFGGLDEVVREDSFEGGSITAIFGGGDVDLSSPTISPEGARVEINALFGGVDMRVPDNCIVRITGVPLFGAWENKTRAPEFPDQAPVLDVHIFVAFGGVELKN